MRSELDDLSRAELLRVAHEYMLFGMIVNRAMLPQVVMHGGGLDDLNSIAIDMWMGASPVYTHRMRELMRISGDNVEAIMKALQLDVGFVHQYMNVAYKIVDDANGEFWLDHCGALLDAEPHGEAHVFGMCHTIEDPTFDATALATNPRARIRPIHRPPRTPADRHPHCHWTIAIDPENEPVGPVPLTGVIAGLPLANVPNVRSSQANGGGLVDYRGAFEPRLRLGDLSSATLAAVAREFQMQSQLLICSGELALRERFGDASSRTMTDSTWTGSAWIASERLAATLDPGGDTAGRVARVLALTPAVPNGFDREVSVDADGITLSLAPESADLDDAAHPGCPGMIARGDIRGITATVHAIDPRASVSVVASDDAALTVHVETEKLDEPVREPDEVALMRIGMVSSWQFSIADGAPAS
jgi:hypothetical protein